MTEEQENYMKKAFFDHDWEWREVHENEDNNVIVPIANVHNYASSDIQVDTSNDYAILARESRDGKVAANVKKRKRKSKAGSSISKMQVVALAPAPASTAAPPLVPDPAPDPNGMGVQENECQFCFCSPCVTAVRQAWLGDGQRPGDRNSAIRKTLYKHFWKLLKNAWRDERYLAKKRLLAGRPDDEETVWIGSVREVMPDCVLSQVRNMYPNLGSRPYMGHKWH